MPTIIVNVVTIAILYLVSTMCSAVPTTIVNLVTIALLNLVSTMCSAVPGPHCLHFPLDVRPQYVHAVCSVSFFFVLTLSRDTDFCGLLFVMCAAMHRITSRH